MRKLIENYSFNPATRQITLIDNENITNDKLLVITNTTDGIMLYNFADSVLRGSISGNVITLAFDTAAMSSTDSIQIWVEDTNPVLVFVGQALSFIKNKIGKFTFNNTGQVRVAIESLPTLSTVTTVGTMTTGNVGLSDFGKPATAIVVSHQAFQSTVGKNFIRS